MGAKLDRQIAVGAVLGAGFAGSLIVTFFTDTRLGSIGVLLAVAGFMLLPKVGKAVARSEATVAADVPRPNWLFRALVFFGPLAVAWFGASAIGGENSLFGPFLVAGFAFCAYSTFRPRQF